MIINKKKSFWIGGMHPVLACIKNKERKVLQIYAANQMPELTNRQINYKIVDKKIFKNLFKDEEFQNQNIAAEIEPLSSLNLKEEIQKIKNVVLLDGVNDPRNIGSIIRTSVAFGIDTIIIKDRDCNLKSPVMYKTASGAMELIKLIEVTNLNNSISLLKDNNFFIFGFDSGKGQLIDKKYIASKNVFVFGSEGFGITKMIKLKCDYLLRLKTSNKIESLNVSNAVSAALSIFYH